MSPIDRRPSLKGAGALGLASLVTPSLPSSAATFLKGQNPIQHIIVDLQENRSFDHYYGFASFVGKYGVPSGYTQPNGIGGAIPAYHFTSPSPPQQRHHWGAPHGGTDARPLAGVTTTTAATSVGSATTSALP